MPLPTSRPGQPTPEPHQPAGSTNPFTQPLTPTAPVPQAEPPVEQAMPPHEAYQPQPPAPQIAAQIDPHARIDALAREKAELLLNVLADDTLSEVVINGPNEVLAKSRGQRFHIPNIRFEDAETYHYAINNYILPYVDTSERINDDDANILIEGQMELPSGQDDVPPMLARVFILCPPLVTFAKITIAKKARYDFDLDGIAATGALSPAMADFLKAAAHARLNMVIAGPTGAGKTTLLQAIARDFDQHDRIIVIEDTPELRLPIADVVYLTSTAPKPGIDPDKIVSTEWLVKATQRMRMNRVIVGECRGGEMAEWLIAANSGAEGSITTVHADNPRRTLEKILTLASKSPYSSTELTLRREIAATVDLVVQAGLVDGQHVVTHIEEISPVVTQNSVMSSQPVFAYNRANKRWDAHPLSDRLKATFASRGVTVDPAWFPLH